MSPSAKGVHDGSMHLPLTCFYHENLSHAVADCGLHHASLSSTLDVHDRASVADTFWPWIQPEPGHMFHTGGFKSMMCHSVLLHHAGACRRVAGLSDAETCQTGDLFWVLSASLDGMRFCIRDMQGHIEANLQARS
eukprot:scaffold14041_cov17-Tisochrysis_lutea.AAC.1